MAKELEDVTKMGQAGMDNAMKMWGEWTKNWQAVTAEMADYTKRSLDDSTKTFEKLTTAKSIEQVVEIQTGFAKRAYDDYVQQMTRLGSMYADLAKGSAKPFEQFMPARR